MEKPANHTLVYDSECPMCELYTKGFINAGMLSPNGRVAYGCANVPVTFDNQRARNEIALIDYAEGTVTYGLDSLVKVIGRSFPLLGKALRWPVIHAPLNVLYSFVSYNRKVIAPAKIFEKRGACTPEYRVGYRIGYILFTWLISSWFLSAYTPTLVPLVPASGFSREFIVCGGQILFQMVIVRMIAADKLLHYLGNMMTVSLIGGLLLLPMIIINSLIPVAPPVPLIWFALVVTFMLMIHSRRVAFLGMRPWATFSWVLYRVVVLCIILL